MVELLKSILAHLQSDDDVSLSDVEHDEDGCSSNHRALSEVGGNYILITMKWFISPFVSDVIVHLI